MPDPQPSQKIEQKITKEVASGIRKLGNDLSNTEVNHLKGYLSKLNNDGFKRGWIFKQPSIQVNNHEEFVQHVVGARDGSGDFKAQFLKHAKEEFLKNIDDGKKITEEEAEAIVAKIEAHSIMQYEDAIDKLRQQEEQARQEYAKVQEKYADHIENWQNGFENKVDTHLERNQEKFEGITEQELRMAKQLALQNLKVDEIKKQLSKIPYPGRQEQEFAAIMDKKIAEQLKLIRTVNAKDPSADKSFSEKNFAEKLTAINKGLKTDVTASVSQGTNRRLEAIEKNLQQTKKTLKEYFPTFTKWGQRAGVVGVDAAKKGGKAAINTAVTAGMISAALAKGSLNAAKGQADKFSSGFFDVVLVIGILLHVIQGMTGGWQGPSPAFYKWLFIFLIMYVVLLLGAPNSFARKAKTLIALCIFFAIEWQWFRIIKLLGIESTWWAFKFLWPTIVIYWVYKSIVNEGKKPIMTWIAIWMIVGFWVVLAYNAVNAGAYIEKYTPEGLSQEEYAQQKTGFYITLAETFGYERVSEFEYRAIESCKEYYPVDYYLEKGNIKFFSRFISDSFKQCIEKTMKEIAENENARQETERVMAARKKATENDFTKLSLDIDINENNPSVIPNKETISGKEVITNAESKVVYNVVFESSKKDVTAKIIASLIKKGAKPEESLPAKIRCSTNLNCEEKVADDGKSSSVEIIAENIKYFNTESTITISDMKQDNVPSVFVKGENIVHFEANFMNLKTSTILPVIFGEEEAVEKVKGSIKMDKPSVVTTEYRFRYWNKIIEKNNLPINIIATYPNNKIEGVYSEHPVVIDIKPLYPDPIIPVTSSIVNRNQESRNWKVDIFNLAEEGKIRKINAIRLYLPKGVTPAETINPDENKCPFKRKSEKDIKDRENKILKYVYELNEKKIEQLNIKERLDAINKITNPTTTGIESCETIFNLNELFEVSENDFASKSIKQKFLNQEFIIEMEYDYGLEKDTKVNVPFDIKREPE